jgi:ATP-dependent helicase/nuclease subunit B
VLRPPAPRPPRPKLGGGLTADRRDFAFEVPRPVLLPAPLDRLRVTAFAAYLSCPYRFYLNHVLRHRAANDDAQELDGAAFGNLAHEVLEQFAASDERDSPDADLIRACCRHLLQQQVRLRYGVQPGPAIRIQVEQLAMRFDAWSRWQADRVREGWRIEHVELSFSETPGEMLVDGQPMWLTGRIDRIDVNEHTGRRQILDYKTSDSGLKPEKTHRRRGVWIDLQLPLYRHLARTLGIDAAVELGYVLLPKSSADVGLALAEWTVGELDDADQVAFDVVRRIRREEFWPPTEPPPQFSEEYGFVCMDGVFGRPKAYAD